MSEVMEIVDDAREFFAPVASDLIDGLLGQYQQQRGYIDQVAGIVAGDAGNAINWFIGGNKDRASHMPSVERLFAPEGAIKALNSHYWSKAMSLTDVYDAMPQKRRDEWSASIREMTAPEFTEDAVRPTIADLLASRAKFFGERVDGIFRALSGEHVTNRPEGFSKRMIIGYVTDAYSYTSSSRSGTINDLRAVIAKFMGRDEPKWNASQVAIAAARRNHGQWMILDSGALRLRVYIKGTAHLEVHPDIAYRLNQVLAGMYPRAIPAQYRSKPKRAHKEFAMMGRPLPFAVLDIISEMRRDRGTNTFTMCHAYNETAIAREEAVRVLASIGGVLQMHNKMAFDYDPREAIDEIIASGCIPDQKAHQYYPTPENVARAAVEMADIGPDDTVLEPSAGQGGIADYLPKERTRCIEISKLHCAILAAKGFDVTQADFIEWAAKTADRFDCIIANPPFSGSRALEHLQAAADLVKPAGRIVAVLPASFKGKDILPGWNIEWSQVFENEFAGTSVSVVIMTAVRS